MGGRGEAWDLGILSYDLVRHAHVDLYRSHIGSRWKDGKLLLERGNQSVREPTAQCRNAPEAKSLASEGTADVLSLPRGPTPKAPEAPSRRRKP